MTRLIEASRPPLLRPSSDGAALLVKIMSAITGINPATMAVVNIKTDQAHSMIVKTVLGNELRRAYENDAYVGLCFSIREIAPEQGKSYSTYDIGEIECTVESVTEPEERPIQVVDWLPDAEKVRITNFFKHSNQTKLQSQMAEPSVGDVWWKPSQSQTWHEWYRPVYLTTKEWAKIKRRIMKRDAKLCRRCGGKGTTVHHRSYGDDVMQGLNDDQLASVCEGCHTFIHADEAGNKRSAEETDRLLLAKDKSRAFPAIKVDLRKRWGTRPFEWPRMTSAQRAAWEDEYSRLWSIGKVQRTNDPKVTEARRPILHMYGMDDAAIDLAMASAPNKRAKIKPRSLKPIDIRPSSSADMMKKRMLELQRDPR
jgi:hypothetical protein